MKTKMEEEPKIFMVLSLAGEIEEMGVLVNEGE